MLHRRAIHVAIVIRRHDPDEADKSVANAVFNSVPATATFGTNKSSQRHF